MTAQTTTGPLQGMRVLELGQFLAGPFAGCILGYFGAEVIKVEPPGGDPLRHWRAMQDGTSLWWRSLARNKKSVVLDLRTERGQELTARLAECSDVLIENFRPGTMERWNLGPERFTADHPRLVYARISGYGQTGPYAHKPGFASVCEGFGGLRHLIGEPGSAPMRANLSLGDSLAGLHAALGIVLALLHRERDSQNDEQGGKGQVVDVALYESVFNVLEATFVEYDGLGLIRQGAGTTITGIAPTNTYRCSDGRYLIIGANGDSIFRRLAEAIGQPELGDDPRFVDNPARVEHSEILDEILGQWCGARPSAEALEIFEKSRVPAGPIYDVADIAADPHYQAREQFHTLHVGERTLRVPAISPRLTETPGASQWAGPELGEHTEEVLAELLGEASSGD
ncbi:MAG: CoA transferase [Acidobacteriota bacterium]